MKVFLIVLLVCYIVEIGTYFTHLAKDDYPYVKQESAADHVIYLLFSIGFGGWTAYLLFF
jgi:hypothetical protein